MDMETVGHLRHQSRSVGDIAPDERRPNECRQGRTGGRAGNVPPSLTPAIDIRICANAHEQGVHRSQVHPGKRRRCCPHVERHTNEVELDSSDLHLPRATAIVIFPIGNRVLAFRLRKLGHGVRMA